MWSQNQKVKNPTPYFVAELPKEDSVQFGRRSDQNGGKRPLMHEFGNVDIFSLYYSQNENFYFLDIFLYFLAKSKKATKPDLKDQLGSSLSNV